ncbi:LysR family transcriptional regulator [Tamaricihabitans halophyticus]|uniref:LysR family transcriptional regulator n=1 Tax=Tamaricihabitans halophyticus TaxID=1262583 RepID=A0A4R2QN17_9PSEU|nr:LysR family transcriptional regulator [Tamaricihabitans halophyticus]TCP50973.1 LysR family transcriptional regulator [Tamaricihabitans halophyticus]
MNLAIHRLRMLQALARYGTITGAAAALHYTASGVSQQLALLEKEVGAPLFERVGRRIRFTELGRILGKHAEDILAAEERAKAALEQARGALTAQLRIGVFATAAVGLLPRILDDLALTYPAIEVTTTETDPEEAPVAVRNGELDLGFTIDYMDAPMPWDAGQFRTVVAVERFHMAAPRADFPVGEAVRLADLANLQWVIAGPKSRFGRAVRAACHREGFEPRVAHQIEEQATAMAMVGSRLGITLVSDLAVPLRPDGVDIIALSENLSRKVVLISRATAPHRPALEAFIESARTASAQLGLAVHGPESAAAPSDSHFGP